MTEEVRYWERLGVYVSRQFAEEYIERSQDSGITGEYLDAELEEFQGMTTVSPLTLRREVDEIFSRPFEEVELPPETKAMMDLIRMEGERAKIIKAYKAEGMTLEEAAMLGVDMLAAKTEADGQKMLLANEKAKNYIAQCVVRLYEE